MTSNVFRPYKSIRPFNDKNNLYSIKIEHATQSQTGWFGNFSFFKKEESVNEYNSFTENGHTYFSVPHNKEYAIRMINKSDLRVNALLKIDGEIMGRWRINQYSDVLIERPSHSNRKFTFVRESSWQAGMGGVKQGSVKNGLVEVIFTPERRTVMYDNSDYVSFTNSIPSGMSNGMSNGMSTGMSNGIPFRSATNFQDFAKSPGTNFMASYAATNNESSRQMMNSNSGYTNNASYSTGATVLGDDSSQRFVDASRIIEDTSRAVTKRVRIVVAERRRPFTSIKKNHNDQIYDDDIPPPIGNRSFDTVSARSIHSERYYDPYYDQFYDHDMYYNGHEMENRRKIRYEKPHFSEEW